MTIRRCRLFTSLGGFVGCGVPVLIRALRVVHLSIANFLFEGFYRGNDVRLRHDRVGLLRSREAL